jgi:MFS superfamily sulfate permease-like transporter
MTAMYIDPAATTVIITSISGIVIAVGAAAVIFWRKAKKKVANVLHIDENANKEVEEDLVINTESDSQ